MPLFSPAEPALTEDVSAICSTAAGFLGMTCVFTRQPRSRVPSDFMLHPEKQSGRIRVRFYCNYSLAGMREEIAAFNEFANRFDLSTDAIWPKHPLDGTAAAKELAARLFGSADAADAANIPPQIHHFSCHYGKRRNSNEEIFVFGSEPASPQDEVEQFSVDRLELETERGYLLSQHVNFGDRGPLVVLNACDSGVLDVAAGEPLIWWLLDAGHRAVLGTETRVPDLAAGRFAYFLYKRLQTDATPLGEAVRGVVGICSKN